MSNQGSTSTSVINERTAFLARWYGQQITRRKQATSARSIAIRTSTCERLYNWLDEAGAFDSDGTWKAEYQPYYEQGLNEV